MSKINDIKFGQVWKAIKNYKIPESWSDQKDCIIPKGTRIVILNSLVKGAMGFHIMPLTSKGLNKKLVPNLKQMEYLKEGYGISVNKEYFKRYFIIDTDQEITFDNADAKEFWETIKAHQLTPNEKKEWDKFISENFPKK